MNRYLLLLIILSTSSCATRRYVREQIAINNCVQVLKAIDRENGVLYAAVEMDAERSGPQRSEIGQKAYDKTVYEMFLRSQRK